MAKPIRIGLLNDMADSGPAPGDIDALLQVEIDALLAAGRIDRPVEFVKAYGQGLPSGAAAAVERAYAQLAEADVLMIVGPAIGDNALVATPLADRFAIPTINWAGAERARSHWMFHVQVGSHEDEPLVIARYLRGLGISRIGVIADRSPIGSRYAGFLTDEAARIGLDIVASATVFPLAQDAGDQVRSVLNRAPDAFVYLGLGESAPAVARAVSESGWTGPCIMNTAGIRGYHGEFARVCNGWAYVDMFSDSNTTLNDYRARRGLPFEQSLSAAKGHDIGRLVAEAIARAPELTREGMLHGLELVKWLPAAEGHEGTLLGFGKQDRGALHGRYLVIRQWQDGRTVELG